MSVRKALENRMVLKEKHKTKNPVTIAVTGFLMSRIDEKDAKFLFNVVLKVRKTTAVSW